MVRISKCHNVTVAIERDYSVQSNKQNQEVKLLAILHISYGFVHSVESLLV